MTLQAGLTLFSKCLALACLTVDCHAGDPEKDFRHPPESAKPGVLWMWMGNNLSQQGITRDLEALKDAGFNRTTMFSLADTTTPWAGEFANSPTPEMISWHYCPKWRIEKPALNGWNRGE